MTELIAMKTGYLPGKLTMVTGDTHIYSNHFEGARIQLGRVPTVKPRLVINPAIINRDWKDITIEDFKLLGYYPEATIKMKMAV